MKTRTLIAIGLAMTATSLSAQTRTPEQKVSDFMKSVQKALHIPGLAYAVIKDGKVVLREDLGQANLTYGVPVKPETVFLLASITKSFTATAIMQLVEQGKVDLDANLSTYLTDAPDSWKDISVRNLLTHTAGLSDRWEEKEMAMWRLVYTKAQMYEASKAKPLDHRPGETWQYSDQGFFLLGMIVEKVSGVSYRQYLVDNLFKPAGMERSTTISLDEITPNLAQGYSLRAGKPFNNNRRSEYGMTSHFGIVSSVDDLVKYDQALTKGAIVKKHSMEEMWTPGKLGDGSTLTAVAGSYGLGWFLETFNGHHIVQHGGSTGTAYFKLPDNGLTIIVLTNLEQLSGGDALGLARTIAKVYVPDLQWSAVKPGKPSDERIANVAKSEISKIVKGEFTEDLYDPGFAQTLKSILPQQKASLSALGAIQSIEYLTELPAAGKNMVFRVNFKGFALYARVLVNSKGKIYNVLLEGENIPD